MIKPLSNINISNMLKDISNFRGVFTIDKLPNRILKSDSDVINYDKITNSGIH